MPSRTGPSRIFKIPRLLNNSPDPVAVVDDQFSVVFANESCCQWLGVTNEELIGSTLNYASADNQDGQCCNGLCPTPELFSGELSQKLGQIHLVRDGKRIFRSACFSRIQTEDESRSAVLIVASGPDFDESGNESKGMDDWHQILAETKLRESALYNSESLVGISDQALRIRRQVSAVAANLSDVLIVGPRGTGKEHVARTVFLERKINNAQLVPIHCAIADSELIQSAIKNWVFDRRDNDSSDWLLLLDVDRLSVDAQSELLGYTRLPDFQMPLFATSTRNLMEMSSAGQFSKSLAMHLSIQTIELVELSRRIEDLPLLVQAFIEYKNRMSSHQVAKVSDDVLSTLQEYHWPRNIAELRRYIEAAHDHCKSTTIQLEHFPEEFRHALSAARIGQHHLEPIELTSLLEEIEKELITRALSQTGNNKTQASKLLGISRARLIRRASSLAVDAKPEDQLIDESEFKEAD